MKVLVLAARGLQAGAVGCYGNPWIDTPALDALAAGGVVFDWHLADAADPAGARRAWRTGRCHLPAPDAPPPGNAPDLMDVLKEQGTFTCLLVDGSRPCAEEFEAGRGEVFHAAPQGGETPLESVLEAARSALGRLAGRDRWLLWVDLATTLPPWDVPEEFQEPYFREEPLDDEDDEEDDEEEPVEYEPLLPLPDPAEGPMDPEDDELFLRLWSSYAAAVTYLDAAVGELTEAVADQDVVIVFTADHGYPLGEHGVVGLKQAACHEEVIHVPLILRFPGGAEAGRRVAALTQAVDLAPTLAELFGTLLGSAQGHSLLPLARGQVEQVREYACSGLEVEGAIGWALRTPEWALLLPERSAEGETRGPQLYVKPDDRWEVNDVIQHHLELAENLEHTLREFVAKRGAVQPPSKLGD
jgi:arylsulfatase A-like enzyme